MTTSPAAASPRAAHHEKWSGAWRGHWRRFGYVVSGLPMGVASFSLVLAALVLGVSTVWLVVTLPILAFALVLAGGFAGLERRRLRWLDGTLAPSYHRVATSGGFIRRSLTLLRDPQRWRDAVHALVIFPVRIATSVVSVTITAIALGGITYPLWAWSLPDNPGDNVTLLELMGFTPSYVVDLGSYVLLGLIAAIATPYVVYGCAALDAGLARLLLSDENAELRARVDTLAATRAAAVDAEARTLRKVERDIHDGPQQRLVRLTMDLQSAQRRMGDDPEAAGALVTEALEHAQGALAELRAVSRGIAPPVLADRGLAAALAAAAARSPVPVRLDDRLGPDRLPPGVENAMYFIVVEALTNVAKHSGASGCTVTLQQQGPADGSARTEVVRAWVVDDGAGGAHVGKGHGLAGLVDRAATLDGTVSVSSPAGGPTIVFAELPLPKGPR